MNIILWISGDKKLDTEVEVFHKLGPKNAKMVEQLLRLEEFFGLKKAAMAGQYHSQLEKKLCGSDDMGIDYFTAMQKFKFDLCDKDSELSEHLKKLVTTYDRKQYADLLEAWWRHVNPDCWRILSSSIQNNCT